MKTRIISLIVISLMISMSFSSAIVNLKTPTVCCEKTTSGLYCQNVPETECAEGAKKVQTSCEATSYCKPGTCFDSSEGTCFDKTPQNVCNQNGGIWTDKPAPQCQLGCCIIGDQAAFVTLTRCKRLSSFLGLETNYNKNLKTEVDCIASVLGQEKGACVFDSEFQRTCRTTTRAECAGGVAGTKTKGEFFKGKLCSAEDLATNCAPTTKTACVPGREEVYFVDTCGNTANIYDAAKVNDKEYWSNMRSKEDSCNPDAANAKNAGCGNCNYLLGSFCRATTSGVGAAKATYGDNICSDLNCKKTSNGKDYKHGESWCVNKDEGQVDSGDNSVGSRFYKHICINGEEVLEACADFRQHVCMEDVITYTGGTFSQAACRVNRWQDCIAQDNEGDCKNDDKRDCIWVNSASVKCAPKNSPGLKFWEGEEASAICDQVSTSCKAKYEKGIISGTEWRGDCVDKKGSLNMGWWNPLVKACKAVGDCVPSDGSRINWVGA